METKDVLRLRRAVKEFDSTRQVSEEQLADLFELATLAPSSWNLQHYQFVVVKDPEQKKHLRKAAMDQEKVEEAAVTIVVCGDLHAYKRARQVAQDHADKGYYGPDGQTKVDQQADIMMRAYQNHPDKAREEAIRSSSLAAMSLMVAAKDMGMDTCPIGGFYPEEVCKVVQLPEYLFPVMLISLGYRRAEPLPRNKRLPLAEIVHIDRYGQPFLLGSPKRSN